MRAWLTPDSSQFAETQRTRFLRVPGSLLHYVTGALMLLAESENWEQHEDATPDETSQFFSDIFDEYTQSEFAMVGSFQAFCRDTAVPFGWIILSGQVVAQADYPELTAVVPPAWLTGSNIQLPDMRGGRTMVGAGTDGTLPNRALGTTGGVATVTLTEAQMPAHAHDVWTPSAAIPVANAGAVPAVPGRALLPSDVKGNSQPHENMTPYLAIRWAIYAGR
jgi:microcystin-dependent protein